MAALLWVLVVAMYTKPVVSFSTAAPPLHDHLEAFSSPLFSNHWRIRSTRATAVSSLALGRQRQAIRSPAGRARHTFYKSHNRQRSRWYATRDENYSLEVEEPEQVQTLLQLCKTTWHYTLQRVLKWSNQPFSQRQQWAILMVFYFFHLTVLSQRCLLFGWQLIPNNKGHFCSVGWDS